MLPASCSSGRAYRSSAWHRPSPGLSADVVLVDIALGAESGFELARRLLENGRDGSLKVILVSTYAEADFADLIAESPASGFLPKSELSAEAIRRVLDGCARP
jgi:DNA-binding NarL/FixJ family response regulator